MAVPFDSPPPRPLTAPLAEVAWTEEPPDPPTPTLEPGHTRDPRHDEACPACPACVRNYDRWALLVGAVAATLRRAFRERKNLAGLNVLHDTLRYFDLARTDRPGFAASPLLQLHPDLPILVRLQHLLEHPPRIRSRRGRPGALQEQSGDWRAYCAAGDWVHAIRAREECVGWVGRAEEYDAAWGDLLETLRDLQGVDPPLLRVTAPPPGAIARWMDGHSEKVVLTSRRLTAARLVYRIVTYLRYKPAEAPPGDAAAADEFVRKYEVAMERRLGRARRSLLGEPPRRWNDAAGDAPACGPPPVGPG